MPSSSAKICTRIFLFFILLIQLSISASAKCHADDESGLLAFKKGIISDPLRILGEWISGTDCCTWPGVSCQGTNRVTSLRIYGQTEYFAGTISPSLSKLKHLNDITFQDLGNISGPFPSFLLGLRNIQHLVILNTKLSGKLPENIGNLRTLITLQLDFNRFSGPIPTSIGGLTHLTVLTAGRNVLSGTIPASMKALKNLTTLRLEHNQLSGAIPDIFSDFNNIQILDLSHNKLSGNIPGSVVALAPELQTLRLGHNALYGKIPDFLGKLQALATLDLSSNKFYGTVPKSFTGLSKITILDLSHNSLVDPFPQLNVKDIGSLDLSYNKFNLVNIPQWVTSSTLIQSLKLAKCGLKLKLDDWNPVETSYYNDIDLSENEITGSPVELLNGMDFLREFYASGNMLKFDLGRLKIGNSLEKLDISRNLVFGKVPMAFAGFRMVNVSHNYLCGQLPVTKFAASSFAGNKCLCGSPLPACKA